MINYENRNRREKKDTGNYEAFLERHQVPYLTSLSVSDLSACQGLIFPGGGDITPAFFGERDRGSRSIDTELDILQLQTLEYGLQRRIPILGICKGMQIINVGLGAASFRIFPPLTVTAIWAQTSTMRSTIFPAASCTVSMGRPWW